MSYATIAQIVSAVGTRLRTQADGGIITSVRRVLEGVTIDGALARASGYPLLIVTPGGDRADQNYTGWGLRQRTVLIDVTLAVSDMSSGGGARTLALVGELQQLVIGIVSGSAFSGLPGIDALIYQETTPPSPVVIPGQGGSDYSIIETITMRFAGELHEA